MWCYIYVTQAYTWSLPSPLSLMEHIKQHVKQQVIFRKTKINTLWVNVIDTWHINVCAVVIVTLVSVSFLNSTTVIVTDCPVFYILVIYVYLAMSEVDCIPALVPDVIYFLKSDGKVISKRVKKILSKRDWCFAGHSNFVFLCILYF